MARLARADLINEKQVNMVHVMNRVVRRCRLMGSDPVTGKNYNHRKRWIEGLLELYARYFGIDLLAYAILDNHLHLLLRTRPDVVERWDDREVARRWLMICPCRKGPDGMALETTEAELNAICNNAQRVKEIRHRLSSVSWWMRLLCQTIAQRANAEEGLTGRFWECRFKSVVVLDDQSTLACTVYIELNWIRAGLAKVLEEIRHCSVQRRLKVAQEAKIAKLSKQSAQLTSDESATSTALSMPTPPADSLLAPLTLTNQDELGPQPHRQGWRCSDRGFLQMPVTSYLELLDWTARQFSTDRGSTPPEAPPVLRRLGLESTTWCELVKDFGKLFSQVAGRPQVIDATPRPGPGGRFKVQRRVRELFPQSC